MAKEPEQHDHFTIQVERVPKELVGDVLGDLAKRNLTNVKYELVTDVLKYKSKTMHEVPARDYLRAWIEDGHPTFEISDAVAHLKADGRTASSCYTAARVLVEEGFLKKLGSGNYSLASVKHITAPKKAAKATKPTKQTRYDVTHDVFILRFARKRHGRFSTKQLKELFAKEGRNEGSVFPACDKLMKGGQIKRVGAAGSGEYMLTAKAAAKKKPKPEKVAPKANGNGSHIETSPEAVTNG